MCIYIYSVLLLYSVFYSYICDACREWVNEVGFFLFNSCLASVLCTFFMQ